MLTDHLLTLWWSTWNFFGGSFDFSWIANSSYLEGDKSKLCSGYTITTPFDVLEVTTLPKATSTQHTELYAFTKGRGTRDQTANIIEKEREFQKNIYFCFVEYTKALDCVDHNKWWKILNVVGLEDGRGIGWGWHFLPYKFIKRSFECWVTSATNFSTLAEDSRYPKKQPILFERK